MFIHLINLSQYYATCSGGENKGRKEKKKEAVLQWTQAAGMLCTA